MFSRITDGTGTELVNMEHNLLKNLLSEINSC